jgi:hypothetical protein
MTLQHKKRYDGINCSSFKDGISTMCNLDHLWHHTFFSEFFTKLDAYRVQQIINMVNEDVFGQIFISDTHPERTEKIIKQTHKTYKIYTL